MQVSIDFADLIRLMVKKLWLIILLAVAGVLLSFGYTKILVTPKYTSSIQLYVSNAQVLEQQQKINYSDISAAQQLVNTYAVIAQSNQVIGGVVESLKLPYSNSTVRQMIRVESVNETEVMKISVTCDNAQQASDIANAFAAVAPEQIKKITKAGYVELVDKAVPVLSPTSPNTMRNCLLGFFFGFAVAAIYIILREMFDLHVKGEEDLKKHYNIPMLGSVPSIHSESKGGYYRYE